ncbi:MAG: sigma-70 family RNA polymerase sigma factor [Ilumatobacteraceae bacterium]
MFETTEPHVPAPVPTGESDRSAQIVVREPFADFYAREVRSIVGLAYVLSGSRAGAEDLAQDAFLAACRRWDNISSYDNAGAWVRRVTVNRSISNARRRVAEAKALLRVSRERMVVPDLSVENEHLWVAVRSLPRRQAQVTALHYWDGLNIREIAEILDLTEATVKTHLQRAREALSEKQGKDRLDA